MRKSLPYLLLGAVTVSCTFGSSNPAATAGGSGGSGSGGNTAIPGTGGTSPVGLTALQITPTTASLAVANGGPPATQQFKVTGTVNGQPQELTSAVTYSATPTGVITIDGSGLATTTGTAGGRVTVTATAGTISAMATVTVSYSSSAADPGPAGSGVPASAQSIFSSAPADQSRAPQLVYPNDGVLFPPNLSGIEIHFLPGKNNTLFKVSFAGRLATVNTFIRCTAPTGIKGCIYLPAATVWTSLATSNAGQGPVTVSVTGTDDSGTGAGTSTPITIQFTQDDILGALYYWTTSGKTAIERWDFVGGAGATPYLTPTNTDGKTCVGCHALSPNGDKLIASAGGENDGRLLLWNVTANKGGSAFPLAQKSQFESWNADGTQFVGMYGDDLPGHVGASNLMLFDGATGAMTSTIDLGGLRADHPDWSKATGGPNTIVFTSVDPTAPTTDQRPATGGIGYVTNVAGTWGPPQVLVPAVPGKNHYYPGISPDGALVVYDESTCANGPPAPGQAPDPSCNADVDSTATMFATR